MILHINDIKLEGDDDFTKQFNSCSDRWQKSKDENLSDEERKEYLEQWYHQKVCLELGIY